MKAIKELRSKVERMFCEMLLKALNDAPLVKQMEVASRTKYEINKEKLQSAVNNLITLMDTLTKTATSQAQTAAGVHSDVVDSVYEQLTEIGRLLNEVITDDATLKELHDKITEIHQALDNNQLSVAQQLVTSLIDELSNELAVQQPAEGGATQ